MCVAWGAETLTSNKRGLAWIPNAGEAVTALEQCFVVYAIERPEQCQGKVYKDCAEAVSNKTPIPEQTLAHLPAGRRLLRTTTYTDVKFVIEEVLTPAVRKALDAREAREQSRRGRGRNRGRRGGSAAQRSRRGSKLKRLTNTQLRTPGLTEATAEEMAKEKATFQVWREQSRSCPDPPPETVSSLALCRREAGVLRPPGVKQCGATALHRDRPAAHVHAHR